MTDDQRTNYWAMFNAARERLVGTKRYNAEQLQQQAISYVWGYQDAGGDTHDTDASWQFGNAYGLVAARYELGEIGSRPPIQNAFKSWLQRREIWGYHRGEDRRLDYLEALPSAETTQPIETAAQAVTG